MNRQREKMIIFGCDTDKFVLREFAVVNFKVKKYFFGEESCVSWFDMNDVIYRKQLVLVREASEPTDLTVV